MNASVSCGIGGPKGMDPKLVKLLHDTFRKGWTIRRFCNGWIVTTPCAAI